jgi:uncharacterized protein with ParB-like and HNH nuclease domain
MVAKIKSTANELADILFPEQDFDDFAENILDIPPEQRKLITESSDYTVETLVNKVLNESIFIPDFQRKYVWSDIQASKLIESLIIQCPIPVIYLNQEPDQRYSVIDGNQRVTSLKRFLNNEFSLKGLTAYSELEGLTYSQLDPRIQRHINNRTLRCISISKDTHPQVKFDVFERLNSGSVKLNKQELRHGLYYGKLIKAAKELVSKTEITKYVLPIDNKNKRMKAEEFILRFWTLSSDFENYKGSLAASINNFIEKNKNNSNLNELEDNFKNTLNLVTRSFGDYSFMTFTKDKEGNYLKLKFNAALYDALMVGLYENEKNGKLRVSTSKNENIEKLYELFQSDKDFVKNISQATGNKNSIKYRIDKIKEIFGA